MITIRGLKGRRFRKSLPSVSKTTNNGLKKVFPIIKLTLTKKCFLDLNVDYQKRYQIQNNLSCCGGPVDSEKVRISVKDETNETKTVTA